MDTTESPAISNSCTLFDLSRIAAAFNANFLDASACAAFVLEHLHHGVAKCPACGVDLQGARLDKFRSFGKIHCVCGKWFRTTTGTALQGMQLDARQLVLVSSLLAFGVDTATIASAVEVTPETVRLWRLKFSALGNQ